MNNLKCRFFQFPRNIAVIDLRDRVDAKPAIFGTVRIALEVA